MSEFSARKLEHKKNWALTPPAFERLLDWLDEGESSDGRKYLEKRRRLVAYFDARTARQPTS
ncbi:MAG: hypothetical protein ACR2G5_04815 [Pyrinomonadaceae bacterium]